MSGKQFTYNFNHAKAKNYWSLNAILGKLGKQRNLSVALQLISSVTEQALAFGAEALSISKSQRKSFGHSWNRTFMKIHSSTFYSRVVQQCQFFRGFLPICSI